jgi:hypothetical protein
VVCWSNRLARPVRAKRPSKRPAVNTVNTTASSSESDRERSRFAAAPTAPRRFGFPGVLASSCALRTGTVRGPRSLKQPNNMNKSL